MPLARPRMTCSTPATPSWPSARSFPNSSTPGNEGVEKVIDGLSSTKYLNFGEERSGFIVTPVGGPKVVKTLELTTANDAPDRDPAMWTLYGTNDPIVTTQHGLGTAENWTAVDTGSVALPATRFAKTWLPVNGVAAYSSYKLVFDTVKNAAGANSMQIAEVQFHDVAGVPEPASLALIGLSLAGAACVLRRSR